MAPSEFGSYKWRVDLKALIKTEPDKGKCTEDIILTKIDTKEMIQVSVHDQVKMNIDIITDILYEEFFMAKTEAFGMPTLALYANTATGSRKPGVIWNIVQKLIDTV